MGTFWKLLYNKYYASRQGHCVGFCGGGRGWQDPLDSRTQLWTHHWPFGTEVNGCQFVHQVSQQQFGISSFSSFPFMNVQ